MTYRQQNWRISPFFSSFWLYSPIFPDFAAGHIPGEGCNYSLDIELIPHCNRNADSELDSLKIASIVAILAIFSTFWPFSPHFSPFTPIFQPPTVSGKVPILLYARIWFIRASERPPESDIAAKLPDWWPIWQFFLLFGHFSPFFPKVCHFLIFFGIIHYIQYFCRGLRQKIRKKFIFFHFFSFIFMGGGQNHHFAQFGPIADPPCVTPPHPWVILLQ